MHRPRSTIALCLLAGLCVAMPAAAHNHALPESPSVAQSTRYPADAALRHAMDGVRNAVEAFEHARHGHMGPEQVRSLADHLDTQIARVFRECTLEPNADASMHTILSVIAKANRAMRENPAEYAPVAAMERALADYGRMFDDPATGNAASW